MRKLKNIFALSVITTLLCSVASSNSISASKRAPRTKSSTKRAATTTRVNGNYNRTTGTFTKSGTTITTGNDTTFTNTDTSIVCGQPASANNNLAKRKCTFAYINALKLYCKSYPCTSKAKVQYSFNFGLPAIEKSVSMDIDGTSCSGENLDKTCITYQGEILAGVWDIYSEKTVRERKHCNMARAKADVAQACLQYIQSEKSKSVDGILDPSKKSKLDEGIDKTCGRDAIIDKYKYYSIDDWTDEDEQYLSGLSIKNDEIKVAKDFQGKKEMSSTVATLFANVGDNTWNKMGQIGKLIELKLDMKSMEYPREIIVLANTFNTELATSCGSDFVTQMADTTFELKDNRSALEREIARKGILKGTFDYLVDNSVGVIAGENSAKHVKEQGIVGLIQEKRQANKDKNCNKDIYHKYYDDDLATLTSLKTVCDKVDETTTKIKTILAHLDSSLKEIENSEEKYKDCRFESNLKEMAEVIRLLSTFARDTTTEIKPEKEETIASFRRLIDGLLKVKRFNCPGGEFTNNIAVEYKFDKVSPFDVKKILQGLENSAKLLTKTVENKNKAQNIQEINELISPLDKILSTLTPTN